jgi:hypothetical protein
MIARSDLASGVQRVISLSRRGLNSVEQALQGIAGAAGAATDGSAAAPEPTPFLPSTGLREALTGAALSSAEAAVRPSSWHPFRDRFSSLRFTA